MELKFPKFAVRYTDDHGNSNEWCSKCDNWLGRRTCKVVQSGSSGISPNGWCNKYERE
jgi:hypothetical protein